jgi:hypothetical protein
MVVSSPDGNCADTAHESGREVIVRTNREQKGSESVRIGESDFVPYDMWWQVLANLRKRLIGKRYLTCRGVQTR